MELGEAIYKTSEVFGMLKFEAKILGITEAISRGGKSYYKILVTPKGGEGKDPYTLYGWGASKVENLNVGETFLFTAEENNGYMNIESSEKIIDVNEPFPEGEEPTLTGSDPEVTLSELPRPPKKAIEGSPRAGGRNTKKDFPDSWGNTGQKQRMSALKTACSWYVFGHLGDSQGIQDQIDIVKDIANDFSAYIERGV